MDGKVTSLTLNGSTTILSNVLYQPFGPTRGWTWGNFTLAIREYDTDGKIIDVDSAGLKSYSYDDAFRIASITDAADAALSVTYEYDAGDRLKDFTPGPPASPSVSLGSSSVGTGAAFSATVTGLPANSDYWVALANTSASASTYSKWTTVPAAGGSFVWNTSAPDFPGTYEVRVFAGRTSMGVRGINLYCPRLPRTQARPCLERA